jgi:hypothetical protein
MYSAMPREADTPVDLMPPTVIQFLQQHPRTASKAVSMSQRHTIQHDAQVIQLTQTAHWFLSNEDTVPVDKRSDLVVLVLCGWPDTCVVTHRGMVGQCWDGLLANG